MAETQTPEPTGWLPEDDEGRVYSDFDEAVEMHLDSLYPEPLPRKVRICGFALKEIDVDSWAAYVCENLIERLDEDFLFEDSRSIRFRHGIGRNRGRCAGFRGCGDSKLHGHEHGLRQHRGSGHRGMGEGEPPGLDGGSQLARVRKGGRVMRCPTCGADTSVIDTRAKGDPAGSFVYRRRDCKAGCARFTTFEVPESGHDPIQVAFAEAGLGAGSHPGRSG